jgi:hypothetical protein
MTILVCSWRRAMQWPNCQLLHVQAGLCYSNRTSFSSSNNPHVRLLHATTRLITVQLTAWRMIPVFCQLSQVSNPTVIFVVSPVYVFAFRAIPNSCMYFAFPCLAILFIPRAVILTAKVCQSARAISSSSLFSLLFPGASNFHSNLKKSRVFFPRLTLVQNK